jgi:thioester reductase-like protein
VTEAESPAGAEALAPGYAQSKWVAENVVRLAMARGLEVTIHRPGFIGWHSRSGAFNRKDFVSGLLAASLSLRATPCLDLVIDVTSVDYVAQAMVHLVRQSDSVNRTYHLNAEAPVSWRDVVAACRERGERWDEVPYPVWRDRMEAARGHMFELFATMLPEQNVEGDGSILDALSPRRFPRFSFEGTRGALGAAGVSCPRMDAAAMAPVLTRIRGALANDEPRT